MTSAEILEILEQESQARNKRQRGINIFVAVILSLTVLSVALSIFRGANIQDQIFMAAPAFLLLGVRAGLSGRAKESLLVAAAEKDPSVARFLIESLDSGAPEVVREAKRTLSLVLPAMSDDELATLSPSHLAQLRNSVALLDSVLGPVAAYSLARLGDRDSIQILETVRDNPKTPQLLKSAATHGLPDLRLRLAKTIIDQKVETVQAEHERIRDSLGH